MLALQHDRKTTHKGSGTQGLARLGMASDPVDMAAQGETHTYKRTNTLKPNIMSKKPARICHGHFGSLIFRIVSDPPLDLRC